MPTGEAYADWEAVYRDNVDRVYRTMFAKVGNRPDAEDLTAEVFLAVLRPLRVSASVGEVRAYLAATARTVLARHWRRTLGLEVTTLDDEHTATAAAEHAPPAPAGSDPGDPGRLAGELPPHPRTALPRLVLGAGGRRGPGSQHGEREGPAAPGAAPGSAARAGGGPVRGTRDQASSSSRTRRFRPALVRP